MLFKFLLTISLVFGVFAGVSEAKPNKPDKKNPAQPTTVIITPVPTNQTVTTYILQPTQREQLISIIRGTGTQSYLITEVQRLEITRQYASLPPGIRKNLARGKGLPPGIAKKFVLPTTVNTYLGIPANRNIIIVGRNIVLLDPVSDRVLDILLDVL